MMNSQTLCYPDVRQATNSTTTTKQLQVMTFLCFQLQIRFLQMFKILLNFSLGAFCNSSGHLGIKSYSTGIRIQHWPSPFQWVPRPLRLPAVGFEFSATLRIDLSLLWVFKAPNFPMPPIKIYANNWFFFLDFWTY